MRERIHHYLGLFFILSLIFTQSLVYVATWAQDLDSGGSHQTSFQAIFIQPTAGQQIIIGHSIQLQAQLSPANNYSTLTFTVRQSATNQELNFEASYQTDGSWRANNIWDTIGWPAGAYNLSATANVYDSAGILQSSFQSAAQSVTLVAPAVANSTDNNNPPSSQNNNNQIPRLVSNFLQPQEAWSVSVDKAKSENIKVDLAIEKNNTFGINKVSGDIYYRATSTGEFARLTANVGFSAGQSTATQYLYTSFLDPSQYLAGDYKIRPRAEATMSGATSTQSIELNAVTFKITIVNEISTPTIKITSPASGQVLNSSISISVELQRALGSGHSLQAYLIEKSLAAKVVLSKYQNRLIALGAVSDGSLIYRGILDPSKYPSGEYSLLVYDESNNSILLGATTVSVVAPTASQLIFLNTPTSNTTIKDNSIYFSLRTSALAEALSIELANTESPAISTGDISIDKTDGTNWKRSVLLDNSFVDGLYDVFVTAQLSNLSLATTSAATQAKYTLVLNRQKESLDLKSISLILDNPQAEGSQSLDFGFSGLANLSVTSNIRSGQVFFVVKDSLEKKVVLRPVYNRITEVKGENNTIKYKYLSVLDTNVLTNGNYYLSAELYYNNKLVNTTPEKLISLYNPLSEGQPLTVDGQDVFLEFKEIFKLPLTSVGLNGAATDSLVFYVSSNLSPRPEPLRLALLDQDNKNLGLIDFQALGAARAFSLNIISDNKNQNIQVYRGVWTPDQPVKLLKNPSVYLTYLEEGGTANVQSNKKKIIIKDGQIQAGLDAYQETTVSDIPAENNLKVNTGDQVKDIPLANGLAVGLFTTCEDVNIKSGESCQAWQAMVTGVLNRRCEAVKIFEVSACEDYLNRTVVDLECQGQGIIDREKCKDYLLEKYGGQIDCRLSEQTSCNDILRNEHLNRLVMDQKDRAIIAEALGSLLGQSITWEQLNNQITVKGLTDARLPLATSASAKVLLAKSRREAVLEDKNRLTITSGAVLLIDSDGDGLPDDLEKYYGTDPNNPDSDGDDYNDSREIKNNFNPLGEGMLSQEHTPLDQVLLTEQSLEQPKFLSDKQSKELALTALENGEQGDINLSGIAPAKSWVSLYLYSDLPLLIYTQADDSGHWQHTMKVSLAEGDHQIFVATNNSVGQISQQSAPLSFLIKNTRVVTAEQYFSDRTASPEKANFIWYYIIGGAILVGALLLLVIFLVRRSHPDLPSE